MKDKSNIPSGIYCYTFEIFPSKENNWKGIVKCCPYWKSKIINNVEVPWCDYLNLGGISNNWTDKDWEAVRANCQLHLL